LNVTELRNVGKRRERVRLSYCKNCDMARVYSSVAMVAADLPWNDGSEYSDDDGRLCAV